jgi:autotransporter-associated beta strand protein
MQSRIIDPVLQRYPVGRVIEALHRQYPPCPSNKNKLMIDQACTRVNVPYSFCGRALGVVLILAFDKELLVPFKQQSTRTIAVSLLVGLFITTPPSLAATKSWSGGAFIGHSWNNSLNWLGGIPTSSDVASVVDGTSFDMGTLQTLDANFTVQSVTMDVASLRELAANASGADPRYLAVTGSASGNLFTLGSLVNGNFALGGNGNRGALFLQLIGNGTIDVQNPSGTLWIRYGIIDSIASYGFTKTGPGTLHFTAAENLYNGDTTVQDTLQIDDDARIGDGSSDLILDGGRLYATLTRTVGNLVQLSANHGEIDTHSGATITLSDVVSGSGSLLKTGDGTLVLSTSNSYSGGTIIASGTLSFAADVNLGASTGTVTLSGGTLRFSGTNASTARAITTGTGGGTIDVTSSSATLTHTGTLSGTGGLTKTGSGTLELKNVRLPSVTVSAATLKVTPKERRRKQGERADNRVGEAGPRRQRSGR